MALENRTRECFLVKKKPVLDRQGGLAPRGPPGRMRFVNHMKTKVFPFLLAAVVCIAVVIAEEQRLDALRQQLALRQKDVATLQEQIDRNAAELTKLRERNEAITSEAEQLRERLGAVKSASQEVVAANSTVSGDKSATKADEQGGWMKNVAKMFKDPEMKKMMRSQQTMGIRMMYGDLAKELGLSTAETDKVMELIADRQMDASEKAMKAMDGAEKDPAKLAEASKEAQDAVTDYDAKLKTALGPEKMAKLTEYERTLGDRMAMQQYASSFSSSGQPLDDTQRVGLLQIMTEERLKTPTGPLDPGNKDVAASMKAMQTGEGLDKALETQRELQQRVLARAHTVLTPDQMNSLEAAQKAQLQMQEMGIKMSKQMFGGDKGK